MNAVEWAVLAGGVVAIASLNWWFFFAARKSVRAETDSEVQRATVVVRGGYEPGEVRLKAGMPTQLAFDRRENVGCSEEIVLPALDVRRYLEPFATTVVDLPALDAGTYEMTCGMSMLRGRIVVEA